jgi:hypothetical protein
MNRGEELQRMLSQSTNFSLAAGGAREVLRILETALAAMILISSSSSFNELYRARRDGMSGSQFIFPVVFKLP